MLDLNKKFVNPNGFSYYGVESKNHYICMQDSDEVDNALEYMVTRKGDFKMVESGIYLGTDCTWKDVFTYIDGYDFDENSREMEYEEVDDIYYSAEA